MILWIVLCAILIGADQWVKFLAVMHLAGENTRIVIPHIFELSYAENDGAALGLFGGSRWFLVGLTALVLVLIVIYCVKQRDKMGQMMWAAVSLVCAGAIGNLLDRLFNSGIVIDMLHFPFLDFIARFSCNVADIYLTVGGILLVIYLLFFEQKKEGDHDAKAPVDSDSGV